MFVTCCFFVPNIRYRPNIRQHFLAKYSFSAEIEKSVFGRSLIPIKEQEDYHLYQSMDARPIYNGETDHILDVYDTFDVEPFLADDSDESDIRSNGRVVISRAACRAISARRRTTAHIPSALQFYVLAM
jgi:hypothetical protein